MTQQKKRHITKKHVVWLAVLLVALSFFLVYASGRLAARINAKRQAADYVVEKYGWEVAATRVVSRNEHVLWVDAAWFDVEVTAGGEVFHVYVYPDKAVDNAQSEALQAATFEHLLETFALPDPDVWHCANTYIDSVWSLSRSGEFFTDRYYDETNLSYVLESVPGYAFLFFYMQPADFSDAWERAELNTSLFDTLIGPDVMVVQLEDEEILPVWLHSLESSGVNNYFHHRYFLDEYADYIEFAESFSAGRYGLWRWPVVS